MDTRDFLDLLTPFGQSALGAAEALHPKESDYLSLFERLSKEYSPALARAALETAILRLEGLKKFAGAERMYFTRAALEQATPQEVSDYRAGRYRGFEHILDLGCSIGGDTLAFAYSQEIENGGRVTGVDLDELRLRMARANMQALQPGARVDFVRADLQSPLPFAACSDAALFFDPARRVEGQRVFSVRDYSPPLSVVNDWRAGFDAIGVKISPGVKIEELGLLDERPEVEFISLRGDLKEAALWFGPLKSAARRATVLPGEHTLESNEPFEAWSQRPAARLPISPPQAYLYEPDAAVIRAGLVEELGLRLSGSLLDADIAYLTSLERIDTPFARVWAVEDWFPFQLKRLRVVLRQRGVGRVTIKKRGSPLEPQALARDLRLKGSEERTLFLTHLQGRPIVILSRDML